MDVSWSSDERIGIFTKTLNNVCIPNKQIICDLWINKIMQKLFSTILLARICTLEAAYC